MEKPVLNKHIYKLRLNIINNITNHNNKNPVKRID